MYKVILLITTITLLLFAVSLLAEDMKKMPEVNKEQVKKAVDPDAPISFHGYLSDVMCGEGGMDPDNNNLTKTPEKHTKACMMSEACIESGYGMFIKTETGDYKFYKFDDRGIEIARDEILPNTEKEDGIMIVVMGKLQEDGTIEVMSLEETKLEEKAEEMKEEVKEEIMKKQTNEEMKKAEMEKQVPGLKTKKVKE